MTTLWQDLRYGIRILAKSPAFTAVAVLTLALGIGANTAIFTVVKTVLLQPLPYPNHARLLQIQETHAGWMSRTSTYATFLDLERQSRSLENISAYRPWVFNITGEDEPEQVQGAMVSAGFFPALGCKPLLGRIFLAEDDQAGSNNNVVVLSYALWQRRFGGDGGVIGRAVKVNSIEHTVIGVMPPGFDFPQSSEVWAPLVVGGKFRDNRRAHLLTVIADLRAGATLARVQTEMSRFAAQVDEQNPGVDPGLAITPVSLQKSLVAPVRPALLILFAAVGLLLLIACANVANLLLARAAARRKEIAIRFALGSGRVRLARQLFTESVLLALLGGIAGLILAAWSLSMIAALGKQSIPGLAGITMDGRVLGFALLVSLSTGLLFGLAPVLRGAKLDLNSSLKEGSMPTAGAKRQLTSQALVVPQFALAMLLLAGAGLLVDSFVRLLRVNPGIDPTNLLTMQVFLSPVEFPEGDPRGAAVLHRMLDGIRVLPGVRSAGLVITLPIMGGPDTTFVPLDRPAPSAAEEPSADIRVADSSYFRTMAIPLLAGREFTEADSAASPRVMIINQTMARRFWPHESPLGRRVMMKDWGPPLTGEIVGVVGDVKANGLDIAVGPMIYWPYQQFPVSFNTIVVRADSNPMSLVASVKGRIWAVDKNQPISRIATMEQVLSDSLARRRLYMILLGTFAGAALILAVVGIYGVMSYSVTQRTHEIGIRMALGAGQGAVMRMIVGQGMKLVLLGVCIGLAAALALMRLMASLLFGVTANDPLTFASMAILLATVALAACYIPARRATRVDPMVALRYE